MGCAGEETEPRKGVSPRLKLSDRQHPPPPKMVTQILKLQALDGRGEGRGRAAEVQAKQSWGLGGWGFGAKTPKSQP